MEEMSTITSPNQVATRLPKWFADYKVILGQRSHRMFNMPQLTNPPLRSYLFITLYRRLENQYSTNQYLFSLALRAAGPRPVPLHSIPLSLFYNTQKPDVSLA
jgi:hypothetical protein